VTSRDPEDEDQKWQEIVANYGDTPDAAELDDVADRDGLRDDDGPDEPWGAPPPEPERPTLRPVPGSSHDPDAGHTVWEPDGWRPPDPGPLPVPTPPRLVAWGGVFGAPTLLLLLMLLPWRFPSWFMTGLLIWFMGGFLYLVWSMNSGPRDPGDDGARV
jgi:hypothetical protein